jgi:glutamate-1-semialdehyde 2,1-aminomutase
MMSSQKTIAKPSPLTTGNEETSARTFTESVRYHDAASRVIAGGVNSNVRLAGRPLCFAAASGARLVDVDGNSYVDYALGMGPAILGHAHPEVIAAVGETLRLGQLYAGQHPAELELASLVRRLIPSAELVRFGVTGSEMVQAALRVARAHTGRMMVIKFQGHYHGWFDNILASEAAQQPEFGNSEAFYPGPQTAGQPPGSLADLLVLPWNNADALAHCFAVHGSKIAAVLMEPMMCNVGVILPLTGYLQEVRRLCLAHGAVLVFDEVITGFRLGLSGAQGRFDVQPDLSVFAKAVGGGFPLAILTGRTALMKLIGSGAVNHSGTYNSNVVSIAAGLATLKVLTRDNGRVLAEMERVGAQLMTGLRELGGELNPKLRVMGVGTVFNTSFGTSDEVFDSASFKQSEEGPMRKFLEELLLRGVRPTGRGTWFVSAAHTEADVQETLRAARQALEALKFSTKNSG